jgi:ribosomal protein L7/L12
MSTQHETERFNLLAQRVMQLEHQLAQVYRHLGLAMPPPEPLGEIAALIASGKKIEAVAKYRELRGGDLAEARAAVDDIAARLGFV